MSVTNNPDLIEKNQRHFRTQSLTISLIPLDNPGRFKKYICYPVLYFNCSRFSYLKNPLVLCGNGVMKYFHFLLLCIHIYHYLLDIARMERRYKEKWSPAMLADFCRNLIRDQPHISHKRQRKY